MERRDVVSKQAEFNRVPGSDQRKGPETNVAFRSAKAAFLSRSERRHTTDRLKSLSYVVASLLCALSLAGCGYMVGSPYSAEIRTIHVPIFTSDTNRRGLEYQLTEAVQKQIQMRTHFRIVKEHQADTRLTGKLTTSRKNVLGLTQNSDPRELQLNLQVEITWVDQRTGEILRQQPVDIPPELVQIASQSEFAPEVGHSLATAEREAIDRLARTIVDLMEMPWPS